MSQKKDARKKTLRYLRWSVKIAFLLILILPINYYSDPTVYKLPVRSFVFGGFTDPPLLHLSYGTSPCSLKFVSWNNTEPGTWLVCPLGGLQTLLTIGNPPISRIDIWRLVFFLFVGTSLFILLIFLFGAAFCSWICPLGTVIEVFDRGVERFMPKANMKRVERLKRSKEKSETKSGFLCPTCAFGSFLAKKNIAVASAILVPAFLGSALLRFPIWCSICPIGILTQGMFHLKAWTHVSRTYMPAMIEFWLIPVFAVLLSLREKMYFCRKICPLGALVRFFASFNPFFKPSLKPGKQIVKESIKKGEDHDKVSCSDCAQKERRFCKEACPQGIGPIKAKGSAECTKCFECYIECENGNIGIKRIGTPDAVSWLRRLVRKTKKLIKKTNNA